MKILKLNEESVNKAAKDINGGGAVVFPTDTVYGLICDAFNKTAVLKVFRIKKRPASKIVSIFVSDIKAAERIAIIPRSKKKFLRNNKITSVFKAKKSAIKIFPKTVIGADGKIGIRIPKYGPIKKLFKIVKKPLVGTSANISGKPASGKISEVLTQFEKEKFFPDLVIDAGNLRLSKPSTVIDLTLNKNKILRK